MNKSDLIETIAKNAELSKTAAQRAVDAFVDVIKSTLANGDAVAMVGFGTFEAKERSARSGRNPQTGETIQIPAIRVPVFKAGKALKDVVSGKEQLEEA